VLIFFVFGHERRRDTVRHRDSVRHAPPKPGPWGEFDPLMEAPGSEAAGASIDDE
jgi:hypothetical protein